VGFLPCDVYACQLLAVLFSGDNLRQVVRINWYRLMPYGWKGNHRSGVALAMHDRLQWFIHLQAQWLTEAPHLHFSAFPFTFIMVALCNRADHYIFAL